MLARHRAPEVVAVALVDLDHFKRVNDTCSHAAGDEVLVTVAGLLDAEVTRWRSRPSRSGYVARLGGEEFLVVLVGEPGCDPRDLFEAMRRSVDEHPWSPVTGAVPVTISAGASRAVAGDSQATLLRRTDDLLYVAKRNGRNLVEHDLGALP